MVEGDAAPGARLFRYRALETATGRVRTGERGGPDAYSVRTALRRIGLEVEAIDAVDEHERLPTWLSPVQRSWRARQRRRRRVARADLYEALATMLEAGLPLEQAVGSLAASPVRSRSERRMLYALREHLRAGTQMSEACAMHPAWFDVLDVSMLEAGQRAGDLARVLHLLCEHHQRGSAIGHRLFTALSYPVFLLIMAVAVVVFLSTSTLPQLLEMLEAAGREPPLITTAVVVVGRFLAWRWWLILLALVGGILLGRAGARRLSSQHGLGRVLASNPISRARRRSRVAYLASTLARLQRSGLPLTEALQVVAGVAGSSALTRLLEDAAEAIRGGQDFSAIAARSDLLDPEFAQLLQLGEQGGELPDMLERIADRYERAANRSIDRLTALLEPTAIVVLAVLIGVVVFAAITPLLQMSRMGM